MQPDAIRYEIERARTVTDRPFNVIIDEEDDACGRHVRDLVRDAEAALSNG